MYNCTTPKPTLTSSGTDTCIDHFRKVDIFRVSSVVRPLGYGILEDLGVMFFLLFRQLPEGKWLMFMLARALRVSGYIHIHACIACIRAYICTIPRACIQTYSLTSRQASRRNIHAHTLTHRCTDIQTQAVEQLHLFAYIHACICTCIHAVHQPCGLRKPGAQKTLSCMHLPKDLHARIFTDRHFP